MWDALVLVGMIPNQRAVTKNRVEELIGDSLPASRPKRLLVRLGPFFIPGPDEQGFEDSRRNSIKLLLTLKLYRRAGLAGAMSSPNWPRCSFHLVLNLGSLGVSPKIERT